MSVSNMQYKSPVVHLWVIWWMHSALLVTDHRSYTMFLLRSNLLLLTAIEMRINAKTSIALTVVCSYLHVHSSG